MVDKKEHHPKYPEPLKTGYFEDQNTPAMQVQPLFIGGSNDP